MNRPYAINHFFCGCHVVEGAPGKVDVGRSNFCGERKEEGCKYEDVYMSMLMEEAFFFVDELKHASKRISNR